MNAPKLRLAGAGSMLEDAAASQWAVAAHREVANLVAPAERMTECRDANGDPAPGRKDRAGRDIEHSHERRPYHRA